MTDSEHRALLLDSVERMLTDRCTPQVVAAAEEAWPGELWVLLEEAGLPLACVPETAGGGGAPLGDALAVARCAAGHAVPLPLGETGLAGLLLAEAGLEVPAGPLATVWGPDLTVERYDESWTVHGTARRVPWARDATAFAVLASDTIALVRHRGSDPSGRIDVRAGRNLAFEPRDDLRFDAVCAAAHAPAPAGVDAAALDLRSALLRAVQIAGGLRAVLDLSVRYASERVQFGRPIGRFQAVQQLLAELAAETAAAAAAADVAVDRAEQDGWEAAAGAIAVAKIRASQAAGLGAQHAHQIHGAIGYTDEHRLHHVTRRLWSWRDEHGSEATWGEILGRDLLADDGDVWARITALGR